MWYIKLFLVILGFCLVIAYFSEKNFKFKTFRKKNNSDPKAPKAKKPFWSEGVKETIRWSIFVLVIVLLLVIIIRMASPMFNGEPTNVVVNTTTTTVPHENPEKTLQIVNINYDVNKWAYVSLVKARDMCPDGWHVGFQFLSASQPYVVKNRSGIKLYSNNCEDISSQVGYTDENLYLYFKAQKKPGTLQVKIYAYK